MLETTLTKVQVEQSSFMSKAVRFSELIKKSGQPYAATLWSDPEKDPALKKAIKENRIVTVKQETVGSKSDFGTIGFKREKNVSYFVFPKKLPPDLHGHIIGIKYDMLDEPKATDPISKNDRPSKPKSAMKSEEKEFTATIKRTAVWETSIQVKAKNKTEAKQKAERVIGEQKYPESEAVVQTEIREIKQS
jgi:hypothetical protein